MNMVLHVLVVAPTAAWFDPVAAALGRGGFTVIAHHAYDVRAAQQVLRAAQWQLVVCDGDDGSGAPALMLAHWMRTQSIDVPLIVLGTGDRIAATQMMQAGAHDYLPLSDLSRVPLAVARELREMSVHRALVDSETRFRQLTAAIDEAFWLVDCASGKLIHSSPACEVLWGRPAALLFRDGSGFLATLHAEDVPRVEEWLMQGGWSGLNGEYRIVQADGRVRWVRSRAFPIHDGSGRPYRSAVLTSDITEARQLEAQMKQMSRALEQTADAVMITDRDGVIEYVNAAFEDITGYAKAEVLGRTPTMLRSGFQDAAFYSQLWQTLLNGLPYSEVFINRRKDGELYYEEKTITPVRDDHGNITHFVSTGKDITRRLLAQQRLHRVLHYDTMTGLANRILFVDRLGQALLQARRLGLVVGVLHVGFDLASLFGEELVRDTEERFQGLLARHLKDAVMEGDTVARLGRDEFAVMHKQSQPTQEFEPLARRIMLEFAQPLRLDGYELFLTPAIGICLYPGDGEETGDLLDKAAIAMRQARERGAQYYFYHSDRPAGGPHLSG